MAELTSNRFPEARRTNLPTDQTERFMEDEDKAEGGFDPEESLGNYPTLRWNRSGAHDTDFQHGPLYIHEKIHPGELIESVLKEKEGQQQDLFAQFNGLPHNADFEWYRHEGYWQNRLIHGDARRVMASLANREGLTQQVQMIYIDPPYNIKFGANFQLRTDETETKESGNDLPHDPLSIKAFRDQYSGNIDTYLDNLYGQLTLARSLLNETGSCFLQIGPENLHEVALLMSEVFGKDNHVATIPYRVATNQSTRMLPEIGNWILWYAKDRKQAKFRQIYVALENRRERVSHMAYDAMCETHDGKIRNLTAAERNNPDLMPEGSRLFRRMGLTSAHTSTTGRSEPFEWDGQVFPCPSGRHWSVSHEGLQNIAQNGRLVIPERGQLAWKRYEDEVPGRHLTAIWTDFGAPQDKRYIVQTPDTAIERCILMTTDPGDLIIDPTCGGGTTAYLAEKWGRRWITIDTSRVAVAVAVARQTLTTSKYTYFLLQDSAARCLRYGQDP